MSSGPRPTVWRDTGDGYQAFATENRGRSRKRSNDGWLAEGLTGVCGLQPAWAQARRSISIPARAARRAALARRAERRLAPGWPVIPRATRAPLEHSGPPSWDTHCVASASSTVVYVTQKLHCQHQPSDGGAGTPWKLDAPPALRRAVADLDAPIEMGPLEPEHRDDGWHNRRAEVTGWSRAPVGRRSSRCRPTTVDSCEAIDRSLHAGSVVHRAPQTRPFGRVMAANACPARGFGVGCPVHGFRRREAVGGRSGPVAAGSSN